jgi:hypothetical protein
VSLATRLFAPIEDVGENVSARIISLSALAAETAPVRRVVSCRVVSCRRVSCRRRRRLSLVYSALAEEMQWIANIDHCHRHRCARNRIEITNIDHCQCQR